MVVIVLLIMHEHELIALLKLIVKRIKVTAFGRSVSRTAQRERSFVRSFVGLFGRSFVRSFGHRARLVVVIVADAV